jgi:hypothetical protein
LRADARALAQTQGDAAAAHAFCDAATAQLAAAGWPLAAWGAGHALCSAALAAAALRRREPLACLALCDAAFLAACRADAGFAGDAGCLRGVLRALAAAACAAAPQPLPPSPPLLLAALSLPTALPPNALRRGGAYASPPPAAQPLPCVSYEDLSVPSFVNTFLAPGCPVLLRGLARDWPALAAWHDLGALRTQHGWRTIPVEVSVGESADASAGAAAAASAAAPPAGGYARGRTRVAHMTIAQLVDEHLAPSVARTCSGTASVALAAPQTAYVSQHGLLSQLPALAGGVRVPRLVCGALRAANAWLGTAGTVTHLHTDDMQNILVQLAGFKLLRLYVPPPGSGAAGAAALAGALRAAPHPRASPGALLNLFSEADAEAPDAHARFPGLAAMPPPLEVVLGPGDAVFIPRGAWHYVRALTPSWSVNFWW